MPARDSLRGWRLRLSPERGGGWIDRYVELEREVQVEMRGLCGPACASCPSTCCRPVYCQESLDSPFLVAVSTSVGAAGHTGATGWLGPGGCRLQAGRPPICYEFLCRTILAGLEAGSGRRAALALGKLIAFVGRRALGRSHLVELDREGLARVSPAGVLGRIDEARAALRACRATLAGSAPSPADLAALDRVAPVRGRGAVARGRSVLG